MTARVPYCRDCGAGPMLTDTDLRHGKTGARHAGRGLCVRCYTRAKKDGRLAATPVLARSSLEFAAAYAPLRAAGHHRRDMAAELGMTVAGLACAITTARRNGLLDDHGRLTQAARDRIAAGKAHGEAAAAEPAADDVDPVAVERAVTGTLAKPPRTRAERELAAVALYRRRYPNVEITRRSGIPMSSIPEVLARHGALPIKQTRYITRVPGRCTPQQASRVRALICQRFPDPGEARELLLALGLIDTTPVWTRQEVA